MTPELRFYKSGHWIERANVPPDHTLLNLLREDLGLRDVKEGCAEGDCGACTVVIAELQDGQLRKRAVNACITLAHALNQRGVITSADLGQADQPHPVHQALVHHHATQCGFCTPGIAMSLVAAQHDLSAGHTLQRVQAQEALSGNLCRCTGYRAVIDAATGLQAWPDPRDAQMREALQSTSEPDWDIDNHYALPTCAEQALQYLHTHPSAQIIAGGTDAALLVTKGHRRFERVLDLTRVQPWREVTHSATELTIGASVRVQEAWAALAANEPGVSELARRFAGRPVRNAATLAGNIANASPIGDSMPALLALDATLTLARWQPQSHSVAQRALALSAFFLGYRQTALQAGELIAAIHIPRSASPATTVHAHTTGQWMRAYKVSKRFEDDISAVCLALWLDVVDGVVRQARIGLGGVAATPLRGLAAEQVLQGQAWTHASAEAAARALQSQCAPLSDMRASSAYRDHLLLALMQRAFEDSQGLGPSSVFVDSIGPVEVTP